MRPQKKIVLYKVFHAKIQPLSVLSPYFFVGPRRGIGRFFNYFVFFGYRPPWVCALKKSLSFTKFFTQKFSLSRSRRLIFFVGPRRWVGRFFNYFAFFSVTDHPGYAPSKKVCPLQSFSRKKSFPLGLVALFFCSNFGCFDIPSCNLVFSFFEPPKTCFTILLRRRFLFLT